MSSFGSFIFSRRVIMSDLMIVPEDLAQDAQRDIVCLRNEDRIVRENEAEAEGSTPPISPSAPSAPATPAVPAVRTVSISDTVCATCRQPGHSRSTSTKCPLNRQR